MYTVPIIPPDLRHEETIIQAAHALCCLEKTIFSVFEKIDKRIQDNNEKIESFVNRVGRAQLKVKGLVGTKKSIKIFAPSRFPASHILRNIPQTFPHSSMEKQAQEERCEDPEEDENEPPYEVNSRPEAPSSQAHNDKLIFFHVRAGESQNSIDLAKARSVTNQQHGLGRMPEVCSVTSTLRFDSDDFVYETESSSSDSWKQAKLFKKQRRQLGSQTTGSQRLQLAPAPHSLTHRDQKAALAGTLRYTPRLSEVPDLNLPMDLPDLPGIADDIQFVAQEHQRIAPSLFIENLPDLSELEQQQETEATVATNPVTVSNSAVNVQPVTVAIPIAPPPPPPLSPNNIARTTQQMSNTVITNFPPPPPPPPPPESSNLSLQAQTSQISILPSITDTHSDLMAAIRSAGGSERARLRPAAPIDAVDNRNKEHSGDRGAEKSSAGGGGLMEELHSKLMLRRKGISGAKDRDSSPARIATGNPLLSHLSSLIPQTTKKTKTTATHIDDDDGEDDETNDTDWTD